MPAGKLQIVPLGGLGEFGMNCMAVRWGDDIIVIDAGLMFPEMELLGVDIVVPDIAYLIENRKHVRAIVLTHGHEDHIGALPWILTELNVPVYGTEFTLASFAVILAGAPIHRVAERILHQMRKQAPGKELIAAPPEGNCACNDCPYMKLNTLEKVYRCMRNRAPEVTLPPVILQRALIPIQRMLAMS